MPNDLWIGSRRWLDKKGASYADLILRGRIDNLSFPRRPGAEEETADYLKCDYPFVPPAREVRQL